MHCISSSSFKVLRFGGRLLYGRHRTIKFLSQIRNYEQQQQPQNQHSQAKTQQQQNSQYVSYVEYSKKVNFDIRELADNGEFEGAMKLKQNYEQRSGRAIAGSTYSHLIRVMCAKGEPELAENVFFDMKARNAMKEAEPLVANIIRSYSRQAKTTKIFSFIERSNASLGLNTLEIILQTLVKVGDIAGAERLYQLMMTHSKTPSRHTFNSLLHGYCNTNQMGKALEHLKGVSQFGADIVTLNTMVNGYCKANQLNEAVNFIEMFASVHNIAPDTQTVNILIEGFCRLKCVNEAFDLINNMEKQYKVRPDEVTYNSLLRAVSLDSKDPKVSDTVLQSMQQNGISLSAVTYNILIQACVSNNNLPRALELLNKMIAEKHYPDVFTYGTLMSAYCKQGRIDQAILLLDEMKLRQVKPTGEIFSIFLSAYGEQGNIEAVEHLAEELKRSGVTLNIDIYNTLIKTYCNIGKIDTAVKVLEEALESSTLIPNTYTVAPVIQFYATRGDIETAKDVLSHYQKRYPGFEAGKSLLQTHIVRALCKAQKINEARELMEATRREKRLDTIMYTVMITGYLYQCRVEEAEALFRQMVHQDHIQPDCKVFLVFMKTLKYLKNYDKALSYYDRMQREFQLVPNLEVLKMKKSIEREMGNSKSSNPSEQKV